MNDVKCGVVRDLTPLVIDDVASPESRELVHAHIETCEGCRGYYQGMSAGINRFADPESDKTFIQFSHRMKRQAKLRKILTWMLVAAVLLVVVFGIWGFLDYKMSVRVDMPIEYVDARLVKDVNDTVRLRVDTRDDHIWYHHYETRMMDGIVYLNPMMPEWTFGNDGEKGSFNEMLYDIEWEDGKLCWMLWDYDENGHPKKIGNPIRTMRWGNENSFTTLYLEGEELPMLESVISGEEVPLLPEKTGMPAETVTPMPE